MELTEVTLSAFKDELEKIAGGFSRSGIRPYRADTLLKRGGRFVKRNFMVKKSGVKSTLAVGATGAAAALYGERKLKKAVEDYRMGREIRKQQGG